MAQKFVSCREAVLYFLILLLYGGTVFNEKYSQETDQSNSLLSTFISVINTQLLTCLGAMHRYMGKCILLLWKH